LLWLISGPNNIVDDLGSTTISGGVNTNDQMYSPGRGMVVGGIAIISVDGRVEQVNERSTTLAWSVVDNTLICNFNTAGFVGEYFREIYALCMISTGFASPAAGEQYNAKLSDRYLYTSGNFIKALPFGASTLITESGDLGVSFDRIGPGRTQDELFLWKTSFGRCAFYSISNKALSSPVMHIPSSHPAVFYLTDFGVIATIASLGSNQYTLSIYALQVQPHAISNPVLIAGATKQGEVATYQVTVTGDQGEVVPNEVINWSVSGSGTLLQTQSVTDENGHATVQVAHGFTDTTASVVGASLEC